MAGENQNQPDDGLDEAERAEFEQMRSDTSGRAHVVEPAVSVEGAEAPEGITVPADIVPNIAESAADKPKVVADATDVGDDEGDDDIADAAPDGTKPKPKRVRFAKFEAEKKRADDLAARLAAKDEQSARLDERMRIINEALQPKVAADGEQADDDPEPNIDEDFIEHAKWSRRQLAKAQERIAELSGSLQQDRQGIEIQRTYEGDAMQFARTEPAFVPAYDWLMRGRAAEMAIYFFGKDISTEALTPQEEAKIKTEVSAEEKHLVAGALKQGKSPAKMLYSMARARGFDPASVAKPVEGETAVAPAAVAANGKGNGKAPGSLAEVAGVVAAKPNGNGKSAIAEEIERVKAGSEAGLSLSQGGGAPTRTLTPEMIANMPEDEFGALMDQLSPAQQRRAMGG